MPGPVDIGTKFNKSGSDLHNGSYVADSVFYADRCQKVRAFVYMTAGTSSVISDVKCKVSGSDDGTHFDDLVSTKDDTTSSATAVEMDYSSMPSAGVTALLGVFEFDPRGYSGGLKLQVKVTGVPVSADNVTIDLKGIV